MRKDGIQGLKLKAIAKRVGVSHTADTPHLGDLDGLLSEFATVGLERLAEAVAEPSGCKGDHAGARDHTGSQTSSATRTLGRAGSLIGSWGLVHGIATVAITGHLAPLLDRISLPPPDLWIEAALSAIGF